MSFNSNLIVAINMKGVSTVRYDYNEINNYHNEDIEESKKLKQPSISRAFFGISKQAANLIQNCAAWKKKESILIPELNNISTILRLKLSKSYLVFNKIIDCAGCKM